MYLTGNRADAEEAASGTFARLDGSSGDSPEFMSCAFTGNLPQGPNVIFEQAARV